MLHLLAGPVTCLKVTRLFLHHLMARPVAGLTLTWLLFHHQPAGSARPGTSLMMTA